ncbi:MFS transporter [Caballeronia sp. LZ035]|uniref:MFS transporter n=1 Tax=Caballeronia sp. LZ035 TaxID=3038568 RepID=UPI00285C119A|nr:MFS transporter [Caballeronia sp. LZ035]MDR5758602.1 MFS transporter [Caballeronia sp. LZ035]
MLNQADTQAAVPPLTTNAPQAHSTRQQLMAAMIGNVLEYYDFIVYAFLAATLARNFFQGDKYGGLLASFAAFGVGFLARPVGGAIIGRIADVHGRRAALLITIFGMAVGTAGIGLLPTYATAGALAPALLVFLRLVQGLAAGGEWGSATSFIVESAPPGKRGFYGGMGQASIAASSLASSVVATIVSASFTADQLDAWAWRLPFLFGGILLPIGLYMRRNIVETPAFTKVQENLEQVERTSKSDALGMMSKAFGFTIIWTVSYYVMLSYMPTFLGKYAGLTTTQALMSNSIALAVLVAATPFFGALSDRVGRKPLLIGCCVGFLLFSYVLFRVVLGGASFGVILAIQIFFNLFIAAFSGAGPSALCELFPTYGRTTLMSIGYSLSTAIFGGFAPFISTWLIGVTGSPIAPAFYLTAAAIVSGIVISTFRETARERLR